jgi:hypothetical protein
MVLNWFWGDVSNNDRTRFTLLSTAIFLMTIALWVARSLHEALALNAFGNNCLPLFRSYRLHALVGVGFVYLILAGLRNKAKLFYLVTGFYSTVFTITAVLFVLSGVCTTNKAMAILLYVATTTFPAIVLTLFWSIAIHTSTMALAKHGFHLIVTAMLLGSLIGPVPATYAEHTGILPLLLLIPICIGIAILVMKRFFDRFYSAQQPATPVIVGKPLYTYLLGLSTITFCASCALQLLNYKIHTIMPYAAAMLSPKTSARGVTSYIEIMHWFTRYGQAISIGAILFALVLLRLFLRKFTVRTNLLIVPIAMGLGFLCLWLFQQAVIIPVVVSIIIHIFNNALYTPVFDMTFIPTSTNAQFRSMALILLAMPILASLTTMVIHDHVETMSYLTLYACGLLITWILAAIYVGRTIKAID